MGSEEAVEVNRAGHRQGGRKLSVLPPFLLSLPFPFFPISPFFPSSLIVWKSSTKPEPQDTVAKLYSYTEDMHHSLGRKGLGDTENTYIQHPVLTELLELNTMQAWTMTSSGDHRP